MEQRAQYIVRLFSWCLTSCPTFFCLYYRKTLFAPCLPPLPIPHFLFSFLWAVPRRGPWLLTFPFIFWQGIWKTSSVSTSRHHIQSSWCLFSSLPYPPTLYHPISHPLSHPPSSWLFTKGLLITILHLSVSIITLQLFPSSPSCFYVIHFPLKFPLCLVLYFVIYERTV